MSFNFIKVRDNEQPTITGLGLGVRKQWLK